MPKMTEKSDLEGLTLLGRGEEKPAKRLETFPNHHPDRDYVVTLRTEEFTCVCPATGLEREMAYQGFEKGRECLKYRCPARKFRETTADFR